MIHAQLLCLHHLAFSLVCSFFFLTLSACLSATLSGLLCHSDDFLLSSAKQLLLCYIYGRHVVVLYQKVESYDTSAM
jgi:hypothetical protein